MKLRTLLMVVAAGFFTCTAHAEDAIKAVSFTTTAGVTSSDAKYFTIEMDNSSPIWAYQFNLFLPEGVEIDASIPLELNTVRYPYSDSADSPTYEHQFTCDKQDDGSWLIMVHTDKTNRLNGTSGEILKVHYTTAADMVDKAYQIDIKNAVMTVTGSTSIYPENTSATMTIGDVISGDVNGDGKISKSDVVNIIGYILGETPDENFNVSAADVNKNGKVTITDAVIVMSMIPQ
jgi:hypothetical protein